MSTDKNAQPSHNEHPDIDAQFAAMMGALTLSDTEFDARIKETRPSVKQQQERLAAIKQEHRVQWQQRGILEVISHRILKHKDGDAFLGGASVGFQRYRERNIGSPDAEVWEFMVNRSTTESSADGMSTQVKSAIGRVPFASIREGNTTIAGGFNHEQVQVVAAQVEQLDALRGDEMQLPALGWNLMDIHDMSTALGIYRSEPKGE